MKACFAEIQLRMATFRPLSVESWFALSFRRRCPQRAASM